MRAGCEVTLPECALGARSGVGNESHDGGPADVARVIVARALSAGRRANDTDPRPYALTTGECATAEHQPHDRGELFPRDSDRFSRDEPGPTRVRLHQGDSALQGRSGK